MPLTFAPLRAQWESLPAQRREDARHEVERLVEQTGMSSEEALAQALFDLRHVNEPPFRRSGLRWDE